MSKSWICSYLFDKQTFLTKLTIYFDWFDYFFSAFDLSEYEQEMIVSFLYVGGVIGAAIGGVSEN